MMARMARVGWPQRSFNLPVPGVPFPVSMNHSSSRSKMVTTALGMKRVAVWTVPTRQKEDMEVGLQRMASVLTYMENRTDIPYSLPKLDWVAVPGFGPIGMENWGLHMSLESVILTSQNHSGAVDSLLIDEIVAHEVAHNWWGNLVTNIWREEIWLNEGLASYFQAYGAEAAATGDGHAERFYLRVTVPALLVDQESEGFSHQLTRPGQDRGSYCGAIGLPQATLTYLKGAAVVRMLQAYLDQNITARDSFPEEFLSGPQGDGGPFLRGAQTYLKRHSFGSTNTSDFLAAFDNATGSPVTDMMSAWLLNGDYPLVEIMTMGDGGLGVYARQNRFRLSGKLSCSASKARWWIPVRYKLKSSPEFKWAAVPSCGRVKLATLADANDTIAANAGRSGYYRVRYREPLRTRLLADALDTPPGATNAQLTHVDLAAMLDDAFHMSFAGVQHFDAFLNLTEVLGSRMYTSHTPWAIALPHLRAARDLLRRSATSQACGDDLEQYARERLLGPMVREASNPYSGAGRGLGFSVGADEPLDFRLMHQGLLQEAGNFGGVDVISKSLEIFFGDGAASLHPDLQSVVYNLAVASGNSSAYEQVKSRFLEAEDPHEKKRLLLALTYVPDPGRINETLQLAFNDAVPDRDKFLIFEKNDFTYTYGGLLARGGRSIDAAADFFADFLTSLYNSFGDCDVRLWIKGIARALLDDEKSQNFVQAASQGFQPGQLEELTARNSQWVARYGQSTCRWLRSRMS
ncbi:unnamed protein product [Ostreobium quekettii]|uniref:Alpha-aminoacylpeptide hydrolase n=1 Tax=Ostreobium quekettii TaxID=121088 RepID=A0A8S1IXI9_9CHLO|nr:unnamed protein product [Ostreobium quekettii]